MAMQSEISTRKSRNQQRRETIKEEFKNLYAKGLRTEVAIKELAQKTLFAESTIRTWIRNA